MRRLALFSRYEEVVTPIARRYRESARKARRIILGRGPVPERHFTAV